MNKHMTRSEIESLSITGGYEDFTQIAPKKPRQRVPFNKRREGLERRRARRNRQAEKMAFLNS